MAKVPLAGTDWIPGTGRGGNPYDEPACSNVPGGNGVQFAETRND